MKEIAFSDFWYWMLVMAIVCYLIGCIYIAVIISKARHKDVHKIGSGNPGAMNISREFGLKIGFLNFMFDVCKGGVPALVTYFICRGYVFEGTDILVSDLTRYFCGMFVILGHIWPVTMRFRGGKGIACTLGLFAFCLPCEQAWFIPIAIGGYLFVLFYIAFTEWGSMGSLIGVTAFSLWQGMIFFLRYQQDLTSGWVVWLFMLLLMINFLTWFAHRKNLVRLFAGEEHRTSVKKLYKGKRGTKNM